MTRERESQAPLPMGDRPLVGVAVGAGYFSQFHFDAWARVPGVRLAAICDAREERARAMARQHGVAAVYTDVAVMIESERPDFIDVITPAASHRAICGIAAERGVHILCQKALAPTFDEAVALVTDAEQAGVRLMVHDNFRFQPWHREIRRLVADGAIGALQAISARTRMGDGWAADAYLSRQPYFRTMPRLLVFETGVHLIDVFRALVAKDVRRVFATLHRRNAAIAGEDGGLVVLEFAGGITALWDASRYHESLAVNPRYTFGEFLIEGERGAIRLLETGEMLVHPLGESPRAHPYAHEDRGFAGDCCYWTCRHFVDRLRDGAAFDTEGRDYLETLAIQEAVYEAAATGQTAAPRRVG